MDDDGNDFLNPDEIDALLNAARQNSGQIPTPPSEGQAPAEDPQQVGADDFLAPDEIENLLRQREDEEVPPPKANPTPAAAMHNPQDILDQAQAHLGEAMAGSILMPDPLAKFGSPTPFALEQFERPSGRRTAKQPLEILQDVELDLRIELGRTEMLIEEVVDLKEGSVVTLDKLAGDPVDILVNGRLIARGEVLVLNDNFCVRVAEILTPDL